MNLNELNLDKNKYDELTNSKLDIFFIKAKNLNPGRYSFEIDLDLFDNDSEEETQELDYIHKTISILNFTINESNQVYQHFENDNNFPKINFSILSSYDTLKIRKKVGKFFSGCTLSHLTFNILKENKRIKVSNRVDFLDVFLNNIEFIIDATKSNQFNTVCPVKFESGVAVELDFKFELGDLTCLTILNRIFKLFSILLNNAKDCENSINFLLENYFQESIATTVRNILDKKIEQKGCDSCNSCITF